MNRILLLPFLLLPSTWVLAAELEVPLEMVAYGIQSDTTATKFRRTRIGLDVADYDGATYYFEIVAKNSDSSNRFVRLIDNSDNVEATITITSSTSNFTRFRSTSWTPTGDDNYRIETEGTTGAGDVEVRAGRIIVAQTGATKTRIQIPLLGDGHDQKTTADFGLQVDFTASATYTQGNSAEYGLWDWNSANWGTLPGDSTAIGIEAVIAIDNGAQTGTAGLHNFTDGTLVTGAEVSTTGTASTPLLVSTEVASSATNFDSGDEFEFRIKVTGGTNIRIYRAAVYVRLDPIDKGEVYYRYSRYDQAAANLEHPDQRVLVNTGLFDSPVVYNEATMIESSAGDRTWEVSDHGTNDSGTGGTPVSSGGLATDSGTRVIVRSGALTITSSNRFIAEATGSSGTIDITHSFLVVAFDAPVSGFLLRRRR